jgi:hypothetical protein
MSCTNFYTYLHRRADTKEVFYVGKGSGRRAFKFKPRTQLWQRIARKHGVIVEIIERFEDERAAFIHECQLIASFKASGIALANFTEGGEGASGRTHSPEAREKMRQASLGRMASAEARARMSAAGRGKKMTPERRAAQVERNKVHLMNPEARQKANEANRGKYVSPETAARISAAKKGIPHGPHTQASIEKMRSRKLGKKASPETKQRMAAAQAARWAKTKAEKMQTQVVT